MTLSRREMLTLTAWAGAALAFPRFPAFAQRGEILKRAIPSSGELLPAVGLGTAHTFNVGESEAERAPLREVVKAFVELGGEVLDTAYVYGNSEEVSGDLAKGLGVTDELFIATKVTARTREQGVEQMQASMRRLYREVIDLMQVHNLRDWRTQLASLREWKAAGRIRYIGITTSRLSQYEEFERVMREEDLDFVQLNYSIRTRRAEERLLPLAQDRGMAVLVNLPYERGRLFQAVRGHQLPEWAEEFDAESWGQFFLKYIISHPGVTIPIPATTNVDHLRDNMGAAYGRLPEAAMRRRMVDYFESL